MSLRRFISLVASAAFGVAAAQPVMAEQPSHSDKAAARLNEKCKSIDMSNVFPCIEMAATATRIIASDIHVYIGVSKKPLFIKDMAVAMIEERCHKPLDSAPVVNVQELGSEDMAQYYRKLIINTHRCARSLPFISESAGEEYFPQARETLSNTIGKIIAFGRKGP